MHEMSIAESLISIVKEEMESHGATSLRSVRLHIGKLSAVVPEALSFCFRILVERTPLEGADLVMDMVPLKGYCSRCMGEFEIEDYLFVCPSCGNTKIDILEGQELSIVEIEVDQGGVQGPVITPGPANSPV